MHLCGLKALTTFNSGIIHLDAGSTMQASDEKVLKVIYSEFRNKTIFWYKYIYTNEKNFLMKWWSCFCFIYMLMIWYICIIFKPQKGKGTEVRTFQRGLKDGWKYIRISC